MPVSMRKRFMYMPMAVFPGYRRLMLMIMVSVIVIMGMFMLNKVMCMLMIMLLKCREKRAHDHYDKCHQKRE